MVDSSSVHCPTHCWQFACGGRALPMDFICDKCMEPFKLLHHLKVEVSMLANEENKEPVRRIIDELLPKVEKVVKQFMPHKMRCRVQRYRSMELPSQCGKRTLFVIMDFKMKYLPRRFAEDQTFFLTRVAVPYTDVRCSFQSSSAEMMGLGTQV